MAIDTGTAHTGVAVSDCGWRLASPLADLDTEPLSTLAARLRQLVHPRRIHGLVIGLPLTLAGRETSSAEYARKVGGLLAAELACTVEYSDERFSSVMTARAGGRKAQQSGKRGMLRHAAAAAEILQTYLDSLSRERGVADQ